MDVDFLRSLLTLCVFLAGISITAWYRMDRRVKKESEEFVLHANTQESQYWHNFIAIRLAAIHKIIDDNLRQYCIGSSNDGEEQSRIRAYSYTSVQDVLSNRRIQKKMDDLLLQSSASFVKYKKMHNPEDNYVRFLSIRRDCFMWMSILFASISVIVVLLVFYSLNESMDPIGSGFLISAWLLILGFLISLGYCWKKELNYERNLESCEKENKEMRNQNGTQ